MEYNQMRIYQYQNGDNFDWVVEYPDLPGCCGAGETIQEAIEEANINKSLWIDAAIKAGKELPTPSTSYSDEYSGKFNLRLPKSLHRELVLQAELDGVSLNTLCSTYLARCLCNTSIENEIKNTFKTSYTFPINDNKPDRTKIWEKSGESKVINISQAS